MANKSANMGNNSTVLYKLTIDPFGKNTNIRKISNSVTHLCSFQNAKHLQNPYPNTAKLSAIRRREQVCVN